MRRILCVLAIAGLSLGSFGCGGKKATDPAAGGGEEKVQVEVTADETAAFAKEAESTITEANVDDEAAALLKEIEADQE